MGYVWCDGYVWDMCGVRYLWDMCGGRYANNLLKNPATKRLSGKKQYLILIPIGSSFKLALQVHGVFQAGDGELQCLDVWQLPILR